MNGSPRGGVAQPPSGGEYLDDAWQFVGGYSTRKCNMTKEIDAEAIAQYLDTQSDFDLELFVYHSLVEHGIRATHGGTYVDPVTRKYRQFDIRGIRMYERECGISMAIECKRLTPEFPLVVLRVPRPDQESFHEVVLAGKDSANNFIFRRPRREDGRGIYRTNEKVGKKTVQIRWDPKRNSFVGDDSDTYDKWSQALSSADALIDEAYHAFRKFGEAAGVVVTFVIPTLVVPDSTLWVADHSDSGKRRDPPVHAEEATLFVDREYGKNTSYGYYVGHLHIFTRTGFANFVKELSRPDSRFREQVFGFVLRQLG